MPILRSELLDRQRVEDELEDAYMNGAMTYADACAELDEIEGMFR